MKTASVKRVALTAAVQFLSLRLSAVRQDIRLRAGRVTGPIAIPNSRGFDFDSGFGFVDAARALRLTAGF